MKRVILLPWKMSSAGAKALQNALIEQGIRCKRVRLEGSYIPLSNDVLINWGYSQRPAWADLRGREIFRNKGYAISTGHALLVNSWHAVKLATDKLLTFQKLKAAGVSIPDYATVTAGIGPDIPVRWLKEGHTVLARTVLNGHSGSGIHVITPEEFLRTNQIIHAPLYVKYLKKKSEYRIHVFKGVIIDVQQKRKSKAFISDGNRPDQYIRSHSNGWVFCRSEVNPSNDVKDQAIKAVQALGLDFGAVDVIWNEHQQKAYVLEVNTAPGLEGETITKYVNAIKELL